MAKIKNIYLNNFRNFKVLEFSTDKKSNILYGDNGSGKTNILESISLIAKGRGFRNTVLSNLIKNNENNFLIKSILEINNNDYEVDIFLKNDKNKLRKIITINQDSSKESIDFINSSLSFLIFLPEMERLFQSSPSYRRNFIDRLIFSENNKYNRLINKYKIKIVERTKILLSNYYDKSWINHIETEITELGLKIYETRKLKLQSLNQNLEELNLSNDYQFKIKLKLKDNFYDSNINHEIYLSKLSSCREYDKKFGGSKIGPHKSDVSAIINNDFDASLLSTGQQKTIVLMMLLAQCKNLITNKNIEPILLFDEICSHLDSNNRKILLDIINQFEIQLFLTGTEKSLFSFISTNVNLYNITDL